MTRSDQSGRPTIGMHAGSFLDNETKTTGNNPETCMRVFFRWTHFVFELNVMNVVGVSVYSCEHVHRTLESDRTKGENAQKQQ